MFNVLVGRRPRGPVRALLITSLAVAAGGCALQGPYVIPTTTPDGRRLAAADVAPVVQGGDAGRWWSALNDPAVDRLVDESLQANPDLVRAVAVVDQAHAQARASRASRFPALDFAGGATRNDASTDVGTGDPSNASAGLTLSWEIDLFGRVRNGAAASALRLEARMADARAARLALVSDVADGVLALRACDSSTRTLAAEIASRELVRQLTVQRRDAGFAADVDVAVTETGLAAAETLLALRRQDCASLTESLVVLTGLTRDRVGATLAAWPAQPTSPSIPAVVAADLLLTSPGVAAAERNVAAAWADIAVARAERLPRVDLTAALTGQWIDALGGGVDGATSLLGAGVNLPLFDGGVGAAGVSASEARYRAAVAGLDSALRLAARDVQNALAAAGSARTRVATARRAEAAATFTLRARDAQWRAGSVNQFEVEDARRQLAAAQDNVIAASRDIAQAWVALVRATGSALPRPETSS